MNEMGLEKTPKSIKKYISLWWKNPRQKNKGGLRLTELGFRVITQAEIKSYKITLENPITNLENNFIIWLDNYFNCPFYLTNKEIFVFEEKTAVQAILFSGNLKMWHKAHKKNKEKTS